MVNPLPSRLLGKYFVPSPGVISVFESPHGPRLVRRCWPFIVTKVSDAGLEAQNTTTDHILNLSKDEILAFEGDIEGPPRYLEPLVFHLNSQICWNAVNLWREPLAGKGIPGTLRNRSRRLLRAA